MNIDIDQNRSSRILVTLSGALCGTTAPRVEALLLRLLREDARPIVVDLAGVHHLSDQGVQSLVRVFDEAGRSLGEAPVSGTRRVRIGNLSSEARDMLRSRDQLQRMSHDFRVVPPATAALSCYERVLPMVRDCFPAPVSDKMRDAYFTQSVSKGLAHLDELKTSRPYYGERRHLDYEACQAAAIPEAAVGLESTIEELAGYFQGHLIWGHPKTQENVIPPASIASIIGQLFGSVANANVIWDYYSQRFAEAEVEAVSMVARLMGYDPHKASGLFTFGGTATTLYGVKLGLEKALPGSLQHGIRGGALLFCSEAAHYAKLSTLGWLGLGMNSLVSVRTDEDNSIDIDALRRALRERLSKGEKIACIIATMGTTDSFGIDDLAAIVELRDQLQREYALPYRPHVHADAVIGWAFAFFQDYDFRDNPMGFTPRALQSLLDTRDKIAACSLADSIGIDFHKTGYTPYISSMLLVRDRQDLSLISRDPAEMPYLFQHGHYHPGIYTLETSRPGSSVLAALANLKLFGKQGYRTLLGHAVSMAGILRARFERLDHTVTVNDYNHGPVTLFRVYPDGVDAKAAYREEISNPELSAQLRRHNDYNRRLHAALKEQMERGFGVVLSITDCYRRTVNGQPIVALKSYVMSPFVDATAMEKVISCLEEARRV